MVVAVTIALTYLLGALPFGLIITRLFGIDDIRTKGSGNIGATNVWRVAGFKVAAWVYLADIGKGVFSVLLAAYVYSQFEIELHSKELFLALCGTAAIVGHIFPVYLNFKGGKGVNTALGAVITLLPVQTFISLIVFVLVVVVFRYISLGSIIAIISLSLILLIQKYALHQQISNVYMVMVIALTFIIIYAHRQNISRIISGDESKFSLTTRSSESK